VWTGSPAQAADPPLGFVKSEALNLSCSELAGEGIEIAIRNETGKRRLAHLSLGEFTGTNGAALDIGKVCGGLKVVPSQVTLDGASGATVKLRGATKEKETFSGSLALFAAAGHVARLNLSITPEPMSVQAAPLVESQSVERDHLSPVSQDPVWVPVSVALSELPPVQDEKKATVLGALAGSNGALAVTYSGERKRLTATTSMIGLNIGDGGAGSYKGKIDLLPNDEEKGTVEINLTMTTWWLFPAIVLALGIAVGVWVQRQIGLTQPVAQLRKRIGELRPRNVTASHALCIAAGGPHDKKPWGDFRIKDLPALEAELLKRVVSSAKGAVVKLDEEVLKDLKAKIAAVETQIDLLEEIPEHGEALEEALKRLEEARPQALPPLDGGSRGQGTPQLVLKAETALLGSLVRADRLKAQIEAIDVRLGQVTILQELEARLGELWAAAESLPVSADQHELLILRDALRTLRRQLWTAAGPEDLTSAAAEVQKARQQVAALWVAVADKESLPPVVQSVAMQGVVAAAPPAFVNLGEEGETQVVPAAPLAGAVPQTAEASVASLVSPLAPTPEPMLSVEQADRKLESARIAQAAVVVLVAIVAFSSGMQALYVGKAWGSTFWEWLAIFVWGVGIQATVTALATSLDGLGALGWLRRSG
jgi:hypothetical protein